MELPPDYFEPICAPLTKTVRFCGFTPGSLLTSFILILLFIQLKLYVLIPLVLIGLLLHYKAIARDSWYIDCLITHAVLVLFNQTRWKV